MVNIILTIPYCQYSIDNTVLFIKFDIGIEIDVF